jgi:hypothetical protein
MRAEFLSQAYQGPNPLFLNGPGRENRIEFSHDHKSTLMNMMSCHHANKKLDVYMVQTSEGACTEIPGKSTKVQLYGERSWQS